MCGAGVGQHPFRNARPQLRSKLRIKAWRLSSLSSEHNVLSSDSERFVPKLIEYTVCLCLHGWEAMVVVPVDFELI